MGTVTPGTWSPLGRRVWLVAYVAVLGGVAALAWAAGTGLDLTDRARLVRYVGILIAAALAIGAPHLLYPDPHARRLQLSNPVPSRLLRHQLGRWAPVLVVLSVPAVVLALGGDGPLSLRASLAAEGALAAVGIGLYVLARVARLGPRSVAWERGEAGEGYRRLRERGQEVSTAPLLAVPDALVPGLLLTAEVLAVGSGVAIAGQASGLSGWGLAGAGALVVLAAGLLTRQRAGFDRAFWTTNGVWSDAFRSAGGPGGGREPLGYTAVYWAPRAIRPAVWAGLVSLDRRLPLGRIAWVGLGLVVAVYAVGAPLGAWAAGLLLWVVVVNGAVALTATDALVPAVLAHRLHGVAGWTLARFLMNVRWLPPLAVTLAGLAWLTDGVDGGDVGGWLAVDLTVAALSALIVTLVARTHSRRVVA